MYILTLNFQNHALIIGFYTWFFETWLHLNKDTSIDDFIIDVIMQATSTFVNLKFHSFIEISY
jgi:hypothetical protein